MSMFLRITLVKWRLFIEIITEKSESVEKLQQMLAQSKIYNIMTGWTDKPELWLQNYVFNLSVNTWALEHISEKLRHQDTGQRSRQLIHLFALHWTSCSAVSIDLCCYLSWLYCCILDEGVTSLHKLHFQYLNPPCLSGTRGYVYGTIEIGNQEITRNHVQECKFPRSYPSVLSIVSSLNFMHSVMIAKNCSKNLH